MPQDDYAAFLAAKAIVDLPTGIDREPALPEAMFAFQRDITGWALRRGRAALFAGTGLGKTIMELGWGDAIRVETRRPILHFAPLAVSAQIVREAEKFGMRARLVTSSLDVDPDHVCVVNYQKMQHFNLADFGATVLDESSILKSVDGHYRSELIAATASVPFRLAATATPAPNDFMELGNHAEFLGVMSYTDMLATFFVHDGGDTKSWRLRGWAEDEFWKWLASWAVAFRKPSDLGYADDGYDLPPLTYHEHVVASAAPIPDGMLFAPPALTLQERLVARRESISERVARAIELTPADRPFVWWCNLNDESAALAGGIDGAVEVRGSDDADAKERKLLDFADGKIRVLVTKPSIAGFGLNWQHCADTGFVGLNDSFEQLYQSVRRFWRFGQSIAVNCHLVRGEREGAVLANLRRKEAEAERMYASMVQHMASLTTAAIHTGVRDVPTYAPALPITLPSWLEAA